MKPVHARFLILLSMASVVLFGARSLNDDPPTNRDHFEFSHGTFLIPEIEEGQQTCSNGIESPDSLMVPPEGSFYIQDYEKKLFSFILHRQYDTKLGWCSDKRVRDTGPFSESVYYSGHQAVRIYYSPKMMYWLTGNPEYWQEGMRSGKAKPKKARTGEVPEGAMIIKEMLLPPAQIYWQLDSLIKQKTDCPLDSVNQYYERVVNNLIRGWVVMVKAESHSRDGWFWAAIGAEDSSQKDLNAAVNNQLDDYSHMQYSSFGQPTCLRCHSSTAEDFTFADIKNVEGNFHLDKDSVYQYCPSCPEQNLLLFYSDNSWQDTAYINSHDSDFFSRVFQSMPSCLNKEEVMKLFEVSPWLRPWSSQNTEGHLDAHLFKQLQPSWIPRNHTNPAFLRFYPSFPDSNGTGVKSFPSQWSDHVVQQAKITSHYITSDNCLGCHGGLGGAPPGVTMFAQTGPNYGDGYSFSEYGEWRWSPMGLAGRDPIFYAQLESEMVILGQDAQRYHWANKKLKKMQEQVTSTCLSCHGAMGQRQLKIDARADKTLDSLFRVEYVYLTEALSKNDKKPANYQYHKYGELAREGISCTVCHHIDPPSPEDVGKWAPKQPNWVNKNTPKELAYLLFHNTTGQYVQAAANVLNGPFKDVKTLPMEHDLGYTPTHNEFTKRSEMCGTCHTINLPNIGQKLEANSVLNAAEQNPALKPYNHTIEQATFLEWQNSAFSAGKTFKSCQDCHMPNSFESLDGKVKINQITTKIATIQDLDYPVADNELPSAEINIPYRRDYRRHEHVGLNAFLLQLFNQFPEILGVSKGQDPMTYASNGNAVAFNNILLQARNETVDLDFKVDSFTKQSLKVAVTVKNKTGHRYPSGVSFRRAFIEVIVMQGDQVVWGSGRTNEVGIIVDENGVPLQTEFLKSPKDYQPHYQRITQQNQVQIYEELNQNAQFDFTTSFIHRVYQIKDNRLLPQGWRDSMFFKSQGEVIQQFMEATDPIGVNGDPDYKDQGPAFPGMDQLTYDIQLPKGVDPAKLSIKVTIYNQSIPPYYLNQRFTTAPNGEATKRLYYLTSHLNLRPTALKDWKLPLVSREKSYKSGGWN